jgi:hypothetical protein
MSSSEADLGDLSVHCDGAWIEVLDSWLRPVPCSGAIGELETSVPPGAYRVSARIAGSEQRRLVVVRGDEVTTVDLSVGFETAAPVGGSLTGNETHGELAAQLTRATAARAARGAAAGAGPAALVIVLRGLRDRPMAALEQTFVLTDAAGSQVPIPPPRPDPYADENRALGWSVVLPSGGYRLRWTTDGPPAEQSIWLSSGWQTILFVPQGPSGPYLPGMSMHLVAVGEQWNPYGPDALVVETALAALRERPSPHVDPRSLRHLQRPDVNPMLVLLTLHLLRLAELSRGEPVVLHDDLVVDAAYRSRTAERLQRYLGPHPDVRVFASERDAFYGQASAWPPMLTASLDGMLSGNQAPPVPFGSPAEAVTGQRYDSTPWLLWDPTGLVSSARSARSIAFGGDPIRSRRRFGDHDSFDALGPDPGLPGPPSTMALDRVRNLLSAVGGTLDLSPAAAAERLGAREIADRLGMAQPLVVACLVLVALNPPGPPGPGADLDDL